jgi:glycerate-2-kinase
MAECLRARAIRVDAAAQICGLPGETEGIDGTEGNAGVLAVPDTPGRATRVGLCQGNHIWLQRVVGRFAVARGFGCTFTLAKLPHM